MRKTSGLTYGAHQARYNASDRKSNIGASAAGRTPSVVIRSHSLLGPYQLGRAPRADPALLQTLTPEGANGQVGSTRLTRSAERFSVAVAPRVPTSDRNDAARGGFDDRAFYDLFATERASWPMPVAAVALDNSFAPFDAWLGHTARTHY
jgi:hypothetical protein